MNLLYTILFLFLLLPQPNPKKIIWSEDKKLSWSDFQGKAQPNANFVASTNSGISFHYSFSFKGNDINVEYSVESFFYPEESWFHPEKVSEYILKHEQTHFDISELYARILRKKLSERNFSKKVKTEIEAIYRKTEQERRSTQAKFDDETDHSRNVQMEKQWENHIAQQLTAYDRWK